MAETKSTGPRKFNGQSARPDDDHAAVDGEPLSLAE